MWFASSAKTVGEDFQGWIVVAGDEGCLEHHMSQQAPSACNGTLAAHGSTVMCDGCEASECSGLFPRDLTKFRHFGNQHGAGDGTDPRDRPKNTRSLGQFYIRGDSLLDLRLRERVDG